MRAAIYARVLLTLCLLALATSASAECAWALWLGTGTGYTPFGAYGGATGEKDCKEAAAQLMSTMKGNIKALSEFLKSSNRYLPPRHHRPAWAEGEVNMPEDIPISTDEKCPACGSRDVHEMPANIGMRTQAPQVAHLWSCEKCRNSFQLVDAAGDQRDLHFDL